MSFLSPVVGLSLRDDSEELGRSEEARSRAAAPSHGNEPAEVVHGCLPLDPLEGLHGPGNTLGPPGGTRMH